MKKSVTREEFVCLIKKGIKNFADYDFSLLQAEDFKDVCIKGLHLNNCNLNNFNPQLLKYKSILSTELSGNNLSYLDEGAFEGVNITYANLSNCNLMNLRPQQVWNKSLRAVDLSGNNISYLEESDFNDVDVTYARLNNCNLKNFNPQLVADRIIWNTDLSGNDLSNLKADDFKGVDVSEANLSNCNLKGFDPQLVENKDIWRLNLSGNDLSYLDENSFNNVAVTGANLSNCKLRNFDPQLVKSKKLYEIQLNGNDLSYLEPDAFCGVNVEKANLSNCNLKNFDPKQVKNQEICGVNLSGNDLSHLKAGAFDGVCVIEANLSNCKLMGFNPQLVKGKNLREANLSGNDLSYLKTDDFVDVNINYANFENTGIHIDLTKVSNYATIGNLKGCSVINFEKALCQREEIEYCVNKILYNEDSFDEKFISQHKDCFLDKTAPNDLKDKFYSRNLDFEDFHKHYEFLKDKNYKLFFDEVYLKLFDFLKLEDVRKVIRGNPKNINKLVELNKVEDICHWYNTHKFVPHYVIIENFSNDQIDKFNCKRWSNLIKSKEFNNDNDAKLGLLKAAMVMGVFEKEEEGYIKLLQMINQEPKVLNPFNVHRIFDSMSMVYDEDFRKIFMENFKRILRDATFSEKISSIQRNFSDIKVDYKGKKVTLEMCENYLENISYDNVKNGCHELTIYAKNNGYNQKDFERLQEIHLEGKKRENSIIPQVSVKANKLTGRILRLDDPLALVLGNLTECCQKLHGVGESAMLHSVLEKNGRVFVVEDEENRIVAQSWVWRNGNVLCFDNIEVPDRALIYKGEILDVYKEASKEFERKDRETFMMLVKEGKVSAKEAKELRLSKITVGIGHTDVNLNKLEKDNERIMPEESNKIYNDKKLYISDSEEQYILYKSLDYKKINENLKIVDLNLYKDGRDAVKVVKGEKIHKDVIRLITGIESKAFPREMQLLQDVQTYKDIAKAYAYDNDNMRVAYNKDWYMVYEEKGDCAHVADMAKVKAITPQEDVIAVKEREKEFYNLLNKYKKVSMEARDKTSYVLMKRLQKAGKIDILVEEALEDFRDGGEEMHKLVVTKNGTNDKNDAIVELGK